MKIKKDYNKKDGQNTLIKASLIVSIITVLGKGIGFIRDAILAMFFGGDWEMDAFFFAQSLPSTIFPAVCNSFSTAFTTIYVTKCTMDSSKESDEYASKMIQVSAVVAIILSVIAELMMPILVSLLAPGFNKAQSTLAITLSRFIMGAFVLTMLQYMFSAILSAKRMYYSSQIAALGYNCSIILLTLLVGENRSVTFLTLSVILGHFFQLVILLYFIKRCMSFTSVQHVFDSDSMKLFKIAGPILIGNSVVQLNNIVDKILASVLGSGGVSALAYSSSLNRFVMGIFITTLTTVIYPTLIEHFTSNDIEAYKRELLNSISIIGLITLPISIITTLFAEDIVQIVYQRGNFGIKAAELTSEALKFYGGMYFFSAIQEVIIRGFYATKDTKTPMRNSCLAILSNSIFSFLFAQWLGIGGIALGTTVSTALACLVLWFTMIKKVKSFAVKQLYLTFGKMLISSTVMVILLISIDRILIDIMPIMRFIVAVIFGGISYVVVLAVLKCKELNFIFMKIKRNR